MAPVDLMTKQKLKKPILGEKKKIPDGDSLHSVPLESEIFALYGFPGHLIRRVHQIAVAHFYRLTGATGLTPVQYACITAIKRFPGVDQKSLAKIIAFDTATISGVVDRLAVKGLVTRSEDLKDRRLRRLNLTPEGVGLLKKISQGVEESQEALVVPLTPTERKQFLALLKKIAEAS
ncbi:MAG: MarR family transcriptional regulator [Rhodocyclaceae bacterium]|nr:MAG: MarR family transcriptional regulator [Rhodocyclaceae bacterium]